MSKAKSVSVRNVGRVPLQAAGYFFPPRATTVVEVDKAELGLIEGHRSLGVLKDAVVNEDAPREGAQQERTVPLASR